MPNLFISYLAIGVAGLSFVSAIQASTTTRTYTQQGLLESIDGPRTDVADKTSFGYDAKGNLVTVTNGLGHVYTLADFDAYGSPKKITDANGVVTLLTYTPQGLLASSTSGASNTQYLYNLFGDITQVTTADGNWLKYSYDEARRLVGIRNRLGESINFTLDPMGNRIAERTKASNGEVVRLQRRVFDELGRLTKVIGADNQTSRYGYDLNNNPSSDISGLNYKTQRAFDALGRVSKVVDALQGATALGYNLNNDLTKVVDPRGVTTRYTFDERGNKLSTTSPDTGKNVYTYDDANNLLRSVDGRGVVTDYTYDALNRVITAKYPSSPANNASFFYDQSSESNYGVGRPTGIQDITGTLAYAYDSRGNIVKQTRTSSVNSKAQVEELAYDYDLSNHLVRTTYPSGVSLAYSRNSAAQVTSVKLSIGDKTINLASTISYQPFGPLKTLTWGNGIVLNRTYDQDYRLTRQQIGSWTSSYNFDADNNIVGVDSSNWGAVQYEYDALGRLTKELASDAAKEYTFDAGGNRTRRTDKSLTGSDEGNEQSIAYSGDSNRLTAINGTAVSADASGNLLQVNGRRFAYDVEGRLSEAYQANLYKVSDYKYNALGQRVLKRSYEMGSQSLVETTTFLYDTQGKLLGQSFYNETGIKTSSQYWFWLDAMPLAQLTINFTPAGEVSGTKIIYLHVDHLDTPRLATDSNQALQWRWNSDAYGVGAPDEDVDGDGKLTRVALRLPGQIYDAHSQLNYNYFRDYDPNTGRYVQSDPIGLRGGLNTFGYVEGNPVANIDFYGLEKLNLANPKKDYVINNAFRNDVDKPGTLIVYAHGNELQVHDDSQGNRASLGAEQLAERIRSSGQYTPSMPIELRSCNTGAGSTPIAQDLANILGGTVSAPNSYYYFNLDGSVGPRNVDWLGRPNSPGAMNDFAPRR